MIKAANRISKVEEYYFSRKLAEVRALDTAEFRVIICIGSPDQAPSSATVDALTILPVTPQSRLPRITRDPGFRKAFRLL